MDTVVLWMPSLFGAGKNPVQDRFPQVKALWPGLPRRLLEKGEDFERAYCPEGLPCSEREMGAYLADIERFGAESARGGDAGSHAFIENQARMENERLLKEADDVLRLSGQKSALSSRLEEQERRKSQRLLAWFWQQERTLAEIGALLSHVDETSKAMDDGLGAQVDSLLSQTKEEFEVGLELGEDELAPDWRICLASALRLAPEGTSFFALGRMAKDLRASFIFPNEASDDGELSALLGEGAGDVLFAVLPSASVLGGRLCGGLPETVRILVAAED